MLDSSAFMGAGGAAANVVADGAGGEEGDRNSAGSRWPPEETMALLKIRSEMDHAFRDSTLKAPLWDEVSRKLGELGYNRSAKKCKEKFENIYKYHKRTKENRSGKQNGKNYKFFEQLEQFDTQLSVPSTPSNPIQSYPIEAMDLATPTPAMMVKPLATQPDFSVPSFTRDPNPEFTSASTSTSSSESEDSDKKQRKLAEYFERLVKDVLLKQEELQNKFLQAIEKCEKERIAREEAWKAQEMARIKREQEFLAQERAMAAAKDAAILDFLQKISNQPMTVQIPEIPTFILEKPSEIPKKQDTGVVGESSSLADKKENGVNEHVPQIGSSSSRWPKAEVESLIMLRTDLDLKYQDNGPKGPLWEEISAAMKRLGYDRSAKRCKEKWENINKYYKRVKESNKRRPEDSKTCPYFNTLEAVYAKKLKRSEHVLDASGYNLQPEHILMQMTGQQQQEHQPEQENRDAENQSCENDVEDEDDENGDGYRVVSNNLSPMTNIG